MEHPVAEYRCQSCQYRDYRMTTKPVGNRIPNGCPDCEEDLVIESKGNIPNRFEKIVKIIDNQFYIWDFTISDSSKEFSVESENPKDSFKKLLESLRNEDYQARLEDEGEEFRILVEEYPKGDKGEILVNILLFVATVGTTFGIAGYWYLYNGNILFAALFSASLLTILTVHEVGHKIFSWKNKVKTTWPYFLPSPLPFLGTFGVAMKNKTPIPSKEALVEIGCSGPFLGFIFATIISVVGIQYSHPIPAGMFHAPFEMLPIPFVYYIISSSIFNGFPIHFNLHPLAWAGFIGLYATWLNLLPAGELDGGQIVRSFLTEHRHMDLTLFLIILFIVLGLVIRGSGLAFLGLGFIILLFLGNPHPGALDDATKLSRKHKILSVFAFVVFILCFPIPI